MCGYIENRVRFLSKKKKQVALEQQGENANDLPGDSAEELPQASAIEDAESEVLVNKMKSLVIDESNLDDVKGDLRVTRSYRSKMLLNKRTDLLESYPYFFTHVDLVCATENPIFGPFFNICFQFADFV